MSNIQYPSPVQLNENDSAGIMELLELHVEGKLVPEKIEAFFKARASATLTNQPRHPSAGNHAYGHWGSDGDLEVFAHHAGGKMNIHSVANGSFMLPLEGYKGAVWADYDAATGKVEFTPLGAAEGRFSGIAYKPGPAAREAIDHQITAHVSGKCTHDHSGIVHHRHG